MCVSDNCLFWIYMATYKSEYTKIIIVESPFVFMDAYQCQRTLLQMRTNTSSLNSLSSAAEFSTKILQTRAKSPSLLECFAKCSWIFYKVTLSFSRTQWYSLLHVSQSYIRNVCIYINNHARARYRFLQNTSVKVSISWLSIW